MADDAEIQDTAALSPDETQNAPPAQPKTVDQFAEEMGWVPKERYTGPEEKWRPADEWLRKEHDINRDLKKKVSRISDQLDRQGEASSRQMARALEKQANQFRQDFADAVANKDTKAAAEAADNLANLRDDIPPERDYVKDFADRNPWYGSNRTATALANEISAELGQKNIPKEKQLEMIEAEMRKEMPDLFGSARKPAASVASPTGGRPAPRAKSVSDLPAEAKKAMDTNIRAMKERFGKIDEDEERKIYARDYWGLQGEQAA